MSSAHIRPIALFLGRPQIQFGDLTVSSFRSSRVPALLAYLILHAGGRASRQLLAQNLWPDREAEAANHNLRQTLLYVRKLLNDLGISDLLKIERYEVSIETDRIETDVRLFEAMLDERSLPGADVRSLLEQGLRLYRGKFLEGFPDLWAEGLRTRLGFAHVQVLVDFARLIKHESSHKALEYVDLAIEEDCYHDEAWALRIEILKQQKRFAEARRQFAHYSEMSERDLGLSPAAVVNGALSASDNRESEQRKPVAGLSPIQALLRAERFADAWNLAIAMTPYWAESGRASLGLEEWEALLSSAATSVNHIERSRGRICIADLKIITGDCEGALQDCTTIDTYHLPELDVMLGLAAGRALMRLRRGEESRRWFLRALRKARQIRANEGIIIAHRSLVSAAYLSENARKVRRVVARALTEAKRQRNPTAQAEVLLVSAAMELVAKSPAKARSNLSAAEKLIGNSQAVRSAWLKGWAARIREGLGDVARAEAGYRSAVAAYRDVDDPYLLAVLLTYLGDLLNATHREAEAISVHEEALAIRTELGEILGMATSYRGIGRSYLQLRYDEDARKALRESVRLFRDAKALPGFANSAGLLAEAELNLNNLEVALKIGLRAQQVYRSLSEAALTTNGPRYEEDYWRLQEVLRKVER